jgi:hypothetical protein
MITLFLTWLHVRTSARFSCSATPAQPRRRPPACSNIVSPSSAGQPASSLTRPDIVSVRSVSASNDFASCQRDLQHVHHSVAQQCTRPEISSAQLSAPQHSGAPVVSRSPAYRTTRNQHRESSTQLHSTARTSIQDQTKTSSTAASSYRSVQVSPRPVLCSQSASPHHATHSQDQCRNSTPAQ